MSIALMTSAWKIDIPSGAKFVLLALCDNANDQGECFPSIPMICEKCSMSERTVQGHISYLEKTGLLSRQIRKSRSSIYHIYPSRFCTPAGNNTPQNLLPQPAISALSTPQNLPFPPAKSAPITIKEPSIESSLNHQGGGGDFESSAQQKVEARSERIELPDWLPANAWEALLTHRKSVKSPMTLQAQKLAIAELAKFRAEGDDPAEVINQTILNGWKRVFALRKAPPTNPRKEKFDPFEYINRNRISFQPRSCDENYDQFSTQPIALLAQSVA